MTQQFNIIYQGDCRHILPDLPAKSIDLVFADPPYNLQLNQELYRPDYSMVDAVDDHWDQFTGFAEYDAFTRDWLQAVRRVMKPQATIWVSGTYHNIFRVGYIMQNMGFWLLNTVSWYKHNAMPNFRGTRLKNDVEFIIWARKSQKSPPYTFNYHHMKRFNDEKQLGSVWHIPACGGIERLRDESGKKLHSTQKPEDLLYRIILASSQPGNVVLDPFMGTGTTAAVARRLHREWVGVEAHPVYVQAARQRVESITPLPASHPDLQTKPRPKRIPFKTLLEEGLLEAGQKLYLTNSQATATIQADGNIQSNGYLGSIHQVAREIRQTRSANGWLLWLYEDTDTRTRQPLDVLRQIIREDLSNQQEPPPRPE